MEFYLRILKKNGDLVFDLNLKQEPFITNWQNHTFNTLGIIKAEIAGKERLLIPKKTIIEASEKDEQLSFYQSLEYTESLPHEDVYLRGTLKKNGIKATILFKDDIEDEANKESIEIFIPTLPKTNWDIILLRNKYYPCKQVIYSKDGIEIILPSIDRRYDTIDEALWSI